VIGPNDLNDRIDKTGSMRTGSIRADVGEVTEAFALGVLIGMVVLTIVAGGAWVLVADESETVASSFEFEYFSDAGSALVTYAEGEELVAGNLEIEGPDNQVTWAELANDPVDAPVQVGDVVQISSGNVYGSSVVSGDSFRIYRSTGANRTELASWTA